MSSSAMDEDLYTLLDDGLGAVVGDRIYPDLAPSDAGLPYVVYAKADEDSMTMLSGLTVTISAEYELIFAAETREDAIEVANALKAMNGQSEGGIKRLKVAGLSWAIDREAKTRAGEARLTLTF